MSKLRVGILGAGRISDLHAIEYLQNPRAEIVAVCDAVEANARRRGTAWGVRAGRIFTRMQDLLACDEVDLVEILLPHHLHVEAGLAAFAAGKKVSLQKPMALSLAEADRLCDAARKANLYFKVFENFVFYPPVAKAKALVEAGAIGEPLSIRIKSNPGMSRTAWDVPAAAEAWRQDPKTCGGGPLTFDDGHHKFAVAWHFMGAIERVHAWIGSSEVRPGVRLDAPAMISWGFSGGRMGVLEVVHSPGLEIDTVQYAQYDPVEITGTRGVLWITRGHGRIGEQPPVVLYADGETRAFSGMPTGWDSSFVMSTRQTIDSALDGGAPLLTGWQGREILRFALAAQESARLGRAVDLA